MSSVEVLKLIPLANTSNLDAKDQCVPVSSFSSWQTLNIITDEKSNDNYIIDTPSSPSSDSSSEARRGRPKSDSITSLILNGTASQSSIKCRVCCRVFPRLKSLQAHSRTHTGEKPYVCDFPRCTRAFAQSGQLKTHQRLHTGERPFVCPKEGCNMRYPHSNRYCTLHKTRLVRDNNQCFYQDTENQDEEVREWLRQYRENKGKTKQQNRQVNIISSVASNEIKNEPTILNLSTSTEEESSDEDRNARLGKRKTTDNQSDVGSLKKMAVEEVDDKKVKYVSVIQKREARVFEIIHDRYCENMKLKQQVVPLKHFSSNSLVEKTVTPLVVNPTYETSLFNNIEEQTPVKEEKVEHVSVIQVSPPVDESLRADALLLLDFAQSSRVYSDV